MCFCNGEAITSDVRAVALSRGILVPLNSSFIFHKSNLFFGRSRENPPRLDATLPAKVMLRQTTKALGTLSITSQLPSLLLLSRQASTQRRPEDRTEKEISQARKWLTELGRQTIPERISKVTYSRCFGAGGQHVNKLVEFFYLTLAAISAVVACIRTNSKARLSTSLKDLLPRFPKPLHDRTRDDRYYARLTDSIIITLERTRSARDNRHDCFRKQLMMLKNIGQEVISGESRRLDPDAPVSKLYVPCIIL